jgi:hypothetical protein
MRHILIILLLIQFFSIRGQEVVPKNNFLYLEGLGNGGYYSLNYEKTLFKSPFSRTYLRAGLSVTYDSWIKPIFPNKPRTFFLTYNTPLIVGVEVGTKNLRYEYGIGVDFTAGENTRHLNMLVFGKNSRYATTPTGLIGLRYYCKKKPVLYRLTLTPFYDITEKVIIPYWIGASVGFQF